MALALPFPFPDAFQETLSPERHPPALDFYSTYVANRYATKVGDLFLLAHRSLSFSMSGSPLLVLAFCIQEIHGIIHGLEC